ncbi:MAG: cytochrome ubiquinol oxidase subunit I [Pseudomonadota bacterium]
MELDPLLLSRIQFAFVVSFHALFPVFTIGLAAFIAFLEARLYRTGDPVYEQISRFWTKIFAVVFGMGVVSGLVMSFQFGTNWSSFSYATANFLGPVLSYEVVTAFFLEAAFLGVLLFGRDKVPQGAHLFSALMVAIGTFISSFWILAANSWMQTPAGFEIQDGIFHITDWMAAIFNPSFWPRFFHMALASVLTGGFVVAGVSAWYLLRNRQPAIHRKALSMTLWVLVVAAPAQLVVGDTHGLNTFEHQPMKVAAMEGAWETKEGAPLLLFAIPDAANETNHLEIGIPHGASLILTHEMDGEVHGLKDVPAEERPPVGLVFWAFRIMIGLGVVMIGFALWGLWLRWRGRMTESRPFLKGLSWMIPAPFLAVLAGWFVTEVGRAPWLVYGIMTHAEGLTPSLTGGMALFTLLGYGAVYTVVFVSGLYYLFRIIRSGPEEESHEQLSAHAKRPLSASDTPFDDPVADPARS